MVDIIGIRLQNVKPSATLAITAKAIELKEGGMDVISLSAGEPDYGSPDHVKKAAIQAINQEKTKYTPVTGITPLKEAIARKFLQENQISYDLEEIIVGSGAKQVIFNALLATLDSEDEVIILAPYWVSYVDMVEIAGGKPIIVSCHEKNDFKPLAQDIANAITAKTKWIIINSPNNPTGALYNRQDLEEIAKVISQHDHVMVMMDDIYEHILFDHNQFCTLVQIDQSLKNRVLTVNGVSKSYAMTGWRIGYGAGPKKLIKAMSIIQSQSTSNPCSISQYAAIAALHSDQNWLKSNKETLAIRRDLVMNLVAKVNGLHCRKPSGAFYLMLNCQNFISKTTEKKIASSSDFAQYLLEDALVATVPGEAFGAPGFIRISYATSIEKIQEAFVRISESCKKLL